MRTRTGYCFGGPLDGKTITTDHPSMRAMLPATPLKFSNYNADISSTINIDTMDYTWCEYAWISPWQRMVSRVAPWEFESTQPRVIGCWLPTDQLEHRKRGIEEMIRVVDYIRQLWVTP